MPDDAIHEDPGDAVGARALQQHVTVQQLLWRVWRVQSTTRLRRLARTMPGANGLTLAVTAAILAQHHLLPREPFAVLASVHQPLRHQDLGGQRDGQGVHHGHGEPQPLTLAPLQVQLLL